MADFSVAVRPFRSCFLGADLLAADQSDTVLCDICPRQVQQMTERIMITFLRGGMSETTNYKDGQYLATVDLDGELEALRKADNELIELRASRAAMLEGLSWQDQVTVAYLCMRDHTQAYERFLAEVLSTGKSVAIPTARQA